MSYAMLKQAFVLKCIISNKSKNCLL